MRVRRFKVVCFYLKCDNSSLEENIKPTFQNKHVTNTVTAGGHAHAHDPGIDIMRMSMTPDIGIFAPLKMPCA
jgi:hypothetical protein